MTGAALGRGPQERAFGYKRQKGVYFDVTPVLSGHPDSRLTALFYGQVVVDQKNTGKVTT